MKADADREQEALAWAVGEFGRMAFMLKPGGWINEHFELSMQLLQLGGESYLNDEIASWSGSDEEISRHVEHARGGNEKSHRLLLEVAASRMKRNRPLGFPLNEYTAEFLRQQKRPKRVRGRKRETYLDRDAVIYTTIMQINLKWGFSPTRNPATDAPSAISIVQKALKKVGIPMTEAAITKIWLSWK